MYYQDMCDDFYLGERFNYMHVNDVQEEYIPRKEVEDKYVHEDDIEKWYISKENVKENYIKKSELDGMLNYLLMQVQTLKEEVDSWQAK